MDKNNTTKKYNNLAVSHTFAFKYRRSTEYEKFRYFNNTNKISNFTINYLQKPKIKYTIENKSYQYSDFQFSIEKIDNISLLKTNNSVFIDKKNQTFDTNIKLSNNNLNKSMEFFTYNKTRIIPEKTKVIRITTQKRQDNTLSTINKSHDSNNLIINDSKPNIENNNIIRNEENNDSLINLELLKSININKEEKDENAFLNSINKPTILKSNFKLPKDRKYNNLPKVYDERGFIYNSNGTYFDNDGDFFNEDGFDRNKGRHDRLGEYLPGPDFNHELGMYNEDIKNLSFDENQLKKEIEDKEKIEFEKIKLEGKESKKLIKDFHLPIVKDDSIDELELAEEFNNLDKTDNSELEIETNEEINKKDKKEEQKEINIKAKNNAKDNQSKFLNGEFNEIVEQNLKGKNNKDKKSSDKNRGKKKKKSSVSRDKKNLNQNNKNKPKKENKDNKKKKRKKSSSVNKNKKEKENTKNKIINKITKEKMNIPFGHATEITEENINKESDFEDLETYIDVKKILEKYNYTEAEKHDSVEELSNLVLKFRKKSKNNK